MNPRMTTLLGLLLGAGVAIPAGARNLLGPNILCAGLDDSAKKTTYTAKLGDDNGETVDCIIKLPAKEGCLTTNMDTDPAPPNMVDGQLIGPAYLCYSVKCDRFVGFTQGILEDQFGTRQITVRKGTLLCVPARFTL